MLDVSKTSFCNRRCSEVLIYIQVPLDYKVLDGSRAAIPLIKIPAEEGSANGTYQGMILTNPGTFFYNNTHSII